MLTDSQCPPAAARRTLLRLMGCGALLPLAACGGGDDPMPPEPPAVATTVTISPTSASFTAVGDQQQFQATVLDQNGRTMTGVTVSWESTHPQIVEIDRTSGLATSTGPGQGAVRARAGRVTSDAPVTVTQEPRELEKAEGDEQQGFLGEKLPVSPGVRVLDANGNPASGISVAFEITSGGGSITPESANTGNDGIARTEWTLGEDSVQTLRATVEALATEFTVTGIDAPLEILTNSLSQGRVTLPYSETLSAKGGSRRGYMWSAVEGAALPAGLDISADGVLQGTPGEAGTYEVELRLTDSKGNEATTALGLRVCYGPLGLAVGDVQVVDPAALEPCGFFLRADTAGAYYRVTFAGLDGVGEATHNIDLAVEEMPGFDAAALRAATARPARANPPGPEASGRAPGDAPEVDIDWDDLLEIERANAALHAEIRQKEEELARQLAAEGPLEILPHRPAAQLQRTSGSPVTFKISDNFSCTVDTTLVTDVIAENDHFVVYEPVDGGTSVSVENAQAMIDFYTDHGVEIIDEYFGGVSDVNGDGKIALLVDPTLSGVQAYVWSADMTFSATSCGASNQMELVHMSPNSFRFNSGFYWALSALVHEVKHVSSLYKRFVNHRLRGGTGANRFHPRWIEEGTAEIAKEMSSRLAWERAGGPAMGDRITAGILRGSQHEDVLQRASYGVWNMMIRTANAFRQDPNSVTLETPDRYYYGSGWHFHRLLRDWVAGDEGGLDHAADASFVYALNDSLTPPGIAGIEAVTGATMAELLRHHAIAMTVAGSEALLTDPATPRFLSYDFPSATETFPNPDPPGRYPWPATVTGDDDASAVTAAVLGEAQVFRGVVSDSGVRFHDFEAMAAGAGAIFHASAGDAIAVIVARIAKPPGF